jgi:hypothetical protein
VTRARRRGPGAGCPRPPTPRPLPLHSGGPARAGAVPAGAPTPPTPARLPAPPHPRHEPNIENTTDAAELFPERRATYLIDGKNVSGVFCSDLTLEELMGLRARQPWPFRSQQYNGRCAGQWQRPCCGCWHCAPRTRPPPLSWRASAPQDLPGECRHAGARPRPPRGASPLLGPAWGAAALASAALPHQHSRAAPCKGPARRRPHGPPAGTGWRPSRSSWTWRCRRHEWCAAPLRALPALLAGLGVHRRRRRPAQRSAGMPSSAKQASQPTQRPRGL